jgi:AcrR family transcriptional regulator
METQKNEIIEKAAKIIMNSGVQELTIHNLADKLNVEESQLYKQLTKDDDILLMLLLGFETDINEFRSEFVQATETPEAELKILFKKLYFLFLQKPYYLDIIFDKNLEKRDESIRNSILRIRNTAENYLSSIINKGKKENTFKTKESTKILVGKILSGFRLYMKDEQRIHEMILELKTLRTLKD